MRDELIVATPLGPARVVADLARRQRAVLLLGHGAGGGIEARDLAVLARDLPAGQVSVLRVEQPWRVAGGRVAPAPPRLDLAWIAVLEALAEDRPAWLEGTVVTGGRSAGARVACRTAQTTRAAAVLALAFPLHPPGRPEKSRADELIGAGVPTLVVQGERDPFGAADELPLGTTSVPIPYADHGFAVPKAAPITQREALELLVVGVMRWMAGLTS